MIVFQMGEHRLSLTALLCLLVLQARPSNCQTLSPLGSAIKSNDTLDKIFSEYFQWKLQTYPEWATLEGLGGYNHLVEDFSMEAIRNKVMKCQEFYDRSRKLTASSEDYNLYKEILEMRQHKSNPSSPTLCAGRAPALQ